ncbi:hypothetical protein [Halobaculum sp. MBLA0143]|uniref:hypothetical protein n=1 Tax=Halobaculum sp. MBLA0143 TaxID=3079933 RepID=UPI0035233A24
MTDALLAAGVEQCRRRGYEVSRPEDGGEPPGVAVPGTEADPPFGPSRALGLEPLAEADPTTVLSRLWTNQEHDRGTVFLVPDDRVAAEVESILSAPVGVRADDNGRLFYTGPDRVPLAEGGYAAVPTGTAVEWRETAASLPPELTEEDSTDGRLELRADGEPLAVLSSVDALNCPPRERFPYAYERDADKRIRVRDYAGRPVETFSGVSAMRTGGFRPVPAPLVPEHMLNGDPTGWWGVVVAD